MMQKPERSASECLCDGECQCPIEALRDRCMQALLLASLADVSDERLRFIPRDSIAKEISREFALKVLQRIGNNDDGIAALVQQATNRIRPRITPDVCHCRKPLCTGSRVIFASLLFAGLHGMLLDFIREAAPEKCDSSLWELNKKEAVFGESDPVFQRIQRLQGIEGDLFFHWAYQLRALCFTTEEGGGEIRQLGLEDGLEDRIRLPWTSIEDAARSSSSALSNEAANGAQRIVMQSSKVQKVCIHRSHHKLVGSLARSSFDFARSIQQSNLIELRTTRPMPSPSKHSPTTLGRRYPGPISRRNSKLIV